MDYFSTFIEILLNHMLIPVTMFFKYLMQKTFGRSGKLPLNHLLLNQRLPQKNLKQIDPLPKQPDPLLKQPDPLLKQPDPLPKQIDPLPKQIDPLPKQIDPLPKHLGWRGSGQTVMKTSPKIKRCNVYFS